MALRRYPRKDRPQDWKVEYLPEPRFVAEAKHPNGSSVNVFVEHVEFIVGSGEPIERVWARSFVTCVDRADLKKTVNREAKKRGYI